MGETPEGVAELKHDVARERVRIQRDVDEIAARVREQRAAIASKVDVGEYAREHPWVALGIAAAAGILLAGTGADAKAAKATARAAKSGGRKSLDLAKGAPAATRGLVSKVKGRGGDADVAVQPTDATRARRGLGGHLREEVEAFIVDLRTEAQNFAAGGRGTAVGTFGAASPFADVQRGNASRPDGEDASFGDLPGGAKLPERAR